jgi:hypothetical protein
MRGDTTPVVAFTEQPVPVEEKVTVPVPLPPPATPDAPTVNLIVVAGFPLSAKPMIALAGLMVRASGWTALAMVTVTSSEDFGLKKSLPARVALTLQVPAMIGVTTPVAAFTEQIVGVVEA